MPEQRRRFSPQFKAEAVQMVIATGRPIASVARDLGVHSATLGNWVNTWRSEHPEPSAAQPADAGERARVKEMEQELCSAPGLMETSNTRRIHSHGGTTGDCKNNGGSADQGRDAR